MRILPEAPIYTLLYDKNKTLGRFEGRVRATSFIDRNFVRNHHRLFLPLMPFAAKSLNLGSEYDLIISDTAGYGKGITYNPKTTKHISYVHTPLRYAWETKDYVEMKFGEKFGGLASAIVSPVAWYLRVWDKWAGERPNILIANSKFIAKKIKDYYGREANVIYPPVDENKFFYDKQIIPQDHYLAVGRLLHYKRFDLIIDSFKLNKKRLLIVGDGPEGESLRKRAAGFANITFQSFVDSDLALRRIYSEAKALIFPHVEDFGLVAAEAQACGLPVVALAKGGVKEIVIQGKTGQFFDSATPEALNLAILNFESKNFNREKVGELSQRFSETKFRADLQQIIKGIE